MAGGYGFRVYTADYKRLARGLKDAANRDLRLAVFRSIRTAARPLGQAVIKEGAAPMPHRGGLAARLAAARLGISATAGGSPKVTLRLRTREGYALAAINKGVLRHPVFARDGRTRTWTQQSVPAGSYTDAFERGAPAVRTQVVRAARGVLDDVARKA